MKPKGFLAEDGPRPEFAELYHSAEMTSADYPARTRANVEASDATIWFGNPSSSGGRTTLEACEEMGKATFEVLDGFTRPSDVAAWIEGEEVRVLNVAGSRESKAPGIGERAEQFLVAVFRRLE